MQFRILGTVEVVGEDGPTPVGGHRERALLARLLLSPNQVVSSPVLTDDLWSGAPTEGAAQALWVHVSRLRKTLRDHGGDDLLVTRAPGYVLQTDLEAIDAYRFETLVERARRLAASGEPAAAAGTFRQALALWRGPALADVADAAFAQAEAARLDEARLTVLEARIEAELAAGLDSDLIGELASLTREHPLRERLWALRMTALYRAGRQAEALRTYQELRRYLGEELGIDPSEELRALEGAILRQEAHLARPDAPPAPLESAPPSPGVVTFMFTDVVGSTELLDRLGDEKADDLRRRHFAALRQALTAHGGSEVKSLGDGLMAAFASPVAALRCAVEIQQTAAAGRDDALAIRIGIHAGEPIADEDDFFGSPVVVAQRLCGRARGGQILASALVQGLAGNRAGCAVTTLGGLVLKGFAEPVAACEVHWAAPATRDVVPLPVPVARQDSVFIRPDADMTRIDEAWEAARSGRRHVVLLAGEPGIGKTRTSAEVARMAHEAGATVLYGRCEERMGLPYQPFVEALGTYLRQAPHPELGRMAGELVRLAPELGERFPDLAPPLSADPDTERYRLFDAVAAWLAAVAAQNPTALLLDDLHWATAPTLAMLVHLACSGEPGSLLVIGTYRDTQLDVTPELADTLADLLRQPDVARVRLGGLDADGVASYLEAMARHELDAEDRELAAVLHAETNGNPFFLNQMLRHLIETGTLHRRDGKWSAGPAAHVEVPDSVRDVIARRLTRLPDETREILTLAAVQGDRFDLRVIVEAAEQPQISVLRALDPAISARLVTEADGFSSRRFVHALVRHTIYDGLPGAERLELHRATGTALAAVAGEAWPEHAGELAAHWLAAAQAGATPDEARRTVEYAEEAARRATASLAYEDAVTQLARALPLVELLADRGSKADVQIELLIALGEAQRRAGDAGHRETLLEASRLAAERGDANALARAVLANTRGTLPSTTGDVDHERVAALEAARDAIGGDDTPTRAQLLAALAAEMTWTGDWERRALLADEALAIARRCGDAVTLAVVLLRRWITIYCPDTLDELLANTEELVALAERLDDPVIKAQALWLRGRTLAWAGDMEEANRFFEAGERLTEELEQPTLRWLVGTTATARTILAGDLEEGERRAHAGFELGQASGQRDAPTFLAAHLFLVRLEQDRLGEVEKQWADVVAALPNMPMARAYLARGLCEVDRAEEAVEHYELLAAENFAALPKDIAWLMGMSQCAAVAASLGDRAGARVLHDLLVPYAGQMVFINGGSIGAVAHYLAVLAATFGDFDEAERRFAEAAGTHERIGAPIWLARTRVEWARMLLTRAKPGDTEQAHDLLHQALATARDRGLTNIERRAVELLSPQ